MFLLQNAKKSKAVTRYDHRLLFISYYILGLLDFKQTSNIFNINYMYIVHGY